jgi:hypothetical protein
MVKRALAFAACEAADGTPGLWDYSIAMQLAAHVLSHLLWDV